MRGDVADVAEDSVSRARRGAAFEARALGGLAFELAAFVTLSRVPTDVWAGRAKELGHRTHRLREALEKLSFEIDQASE